MAARALRVLTPALALLAGAAAAAGADESSLVDLLRSAGEYVVGYADSFRIVVAQETYVQRLRTSPGGPVQQTRRLDSDVVFVHVSDAGFPWWLLRDVYEVDGHPVRDRQARLEKLLVGPMKDGLAWAQAIADDGARFNLGRGHWNFNVPTLVLAFLHPSVQPRFTFERKGRATIEGRSFVEIAFRELSPPTVVRGPDSHPDILATGRVWVHDGHDGTVGRTELALELRTDRATTRATVTTQYRPYRPLALWVPLEMHDRVQTDAVGWRGPSSSVEVVEGLAAYSGFRQAGVSTQEEFRVPEAEPR
jgi:hypothetical protein